MPDPFKSRATPMNPLPDNRPAGDEKERNDGPGEEMAERGYRVLDRANPRSWDRNRAGLTPRVYDGPNRAYDED